MRQNMCGEQMLYHVVEKFVSINGEGERAGEPAVFIRLAGCPLRCSYCDTGYALSYDSPCELMTAEDICAYIMETGITNVTLTGGEPLAAEGIDILLAQLSGLPVRLEIETSGAVDISVCRVSPSAVVTVDYKLPSSGMESRMVIKNFTVLEPEDTVKFVAGSREDLDRTLEVIREYHLTEKCHVHISPVWGKLSPSEIADFIVGNRLNGVRLQMQIHKIVWDPNRRGV